MFVELHVIVETKLQKFPNEKALRQRITFRVILHQLRKLVEYSSALFSQ